MDANASNICGFMQMSPFSHRGHTPPYDRPGLLTRFPHIIGLQMLQNILSVSTCHVANRLSVDHLTGLQN